MYDDYEVVINMPEDMTEFYKGVAEFSLEYFLKKCPKEIQIPVLDGVIEALKKREVN
ncbi:hypothetical protein [Clostridium sp. YIM B02506]|uniref:hypothetical protein n=1 Tax=Clostridium sp. YIM B02506 TaxID=2910680 RepID=UPI001EEDA606|nr:hypothetical protein [Clostridium sp. YIM B02506]